MSSSNPATVTAWQRARLGRLRVGWAERPAAHPDGLHERERSCLERLDLNDARRAEWIAARLGLAGILPTGAHVVTSPDGAPEVVGAAWAASIAHEDGWVAVAARPGGGRVAIDVVPDSAAPAAARALARVRLSGSDCAPAAAWAALECAAKLRGVGVALLLDRRVRIARLGPVALAVEGLGRRAARVRIHRLPGAVLALADEP
ncbi:MAG TPA: hypothetical protein VIG06_21900 [Kofleriaceae bacterium]|jgi:phosphopantetheinyl transferase